MRAFTQIIAVLTLLLLGHAAAADGERYALLVGVSEYRRDSGLSKLNYADSDMTALSAALVRAGFKSQHVFLMTKSRGGDDSTLPRRDNIELQLALLLNNKRKDDTVIVVFAGHGLQFRNDRESYFCPSDARKEAGGSRIDKNTLINVSSVYDRLEKCGAGNKLLISDCCRNDPLDPQTRDASGDSVKTGQLNRRVESATRPVPLPAPESVAVLLSCAEGEVAFEEKEEFQGGVFTHFLIEGLNGKAALDGIVNVESLAAYLRQHVYDHVHRRFLAAQTPEIKLKGNKSFVLANQRPATKPVVPNPDASATTTKKPDPAAHFEVVDTAKTPNAFSNRNGGGRKLMTQRHGGSNVTENAVDAALRWLAYHQEVDGHWDARKFAAAEKTDSAVTALSLLAFLGAGHSEKAGEYKDSVKRAVAWLKSKQAASGLIWDTTDAGGHRGEGYPGAICALAMAEAAGMSNIPETRDAAQKAIDYFTDIHAAEGNLGWRYHPKMGGDTSVTAWVVMALKSGKYAGLKVNPAAFDGAIQYLDSVEHVVKGEPGKPQASTYWYMPKTAQEPHRLTAMGSLCRQFLGWKKEDMQPTVEGFIAKGGVPNWGGNGATVDLYYWYYGTLCAFNQGGDVWKQWNDALKIALLPNQRKDGDDSGSWDVLGAYSTEWGRVGQTALSALCLEVYYRYAPIYSK